MHEVIFASNGLLSTIETGIICDMTTGDPVITRQIANELPSGISLVDAPVSGGPAGATAGTLAIMVVGVITPSGKQCLRLKLSVLIFSEQAM